MGKTNGTQQPTTKQALLGAQTIAKYCKQQPGCQNCIFRQFGADSWRCHIDAIDLQEVLDNIEKKKKNGGYL